MPLNAVPLAFQRQGEGEPPLLILHGMFGSGRNWQTLARRWAAGRTVYTPDLRGHGASPHAAPLDYPHLAADVLALMDAQGIDVADLLGHSMGGKVAMWLALAAPERVRRLVVVDIAPAASAWDFGALVEILQALPLDRLTNRADADARLADRIESVALRQFLLQNLVYRDGGWAWRIDLALLHRAMPALMDFPVEEGAVFDRPVLFVAGGESQHLRPEHADVIARLFPDALRVEIPGAGHWPHRDDPERFQAVVQAFYAAA